MLQLGTTMAFDNIKKTAKYHGFGFMDEKQYNNISVSARGFHVEDHSVEEDNNEMWIYRGKLLMGMDELDIAMFDQSITTLVNKKMVC